MARTMIRSLHEFQVTRSIVPLLPVHVMDQLAGPGDHSVRLPVDEVMLIAVQASVPLSGVPFRGFHQLVRPVPHSGSVEPELTPASPLYR